MFILIRCAEHHAQDDGDGIGLLHFSVILSGVPQARSRRIRFLLELRMEFAGGRILRRASLAQNDR